MLDFDTKTCGFPSKEIKKETLNEEEMARRTLEDLAKLPAYPGEAKVTENYDTASRRDAVIAKPLRTTEQLPSRAEVATTSTGQKL
jgi:hypothetical protein